MKKLLFLVLLVIPITSYSQNKIIHPVTLMLSFQPYEYATGIRYEHQLTNKYGLYGNLLMSNTNDYMKYSIGGTYHTKFDKNTHSCGSFGMGILYHDIDKELCVDEMKI